MGVRSKIMTVYLVGKYSYIDIEDVKAGGQVKTWVSS